MKNRLAALAGALALLAVLGKYYATPVLAQVRAAIVKNIDEKGRIPYHEFASCENPSTVLPCIVNFPPVPANRRLVIEYVNAEFRVNAGFAPSVDISFLGPGNLNKRFTLPSFLKVGPNTYGTSSPVLMYVEAGRVVSLATFGSVGEASLVGYLVDLTQ